MCLRKKARKKYTLKFDVKDLIKYKQHAKQNVQMNKSFEIFSNKIKKISRIYTETKSSSKTKTSSVTLIRLISMNTGKKCATNKY